MKRIALSALIAFIALTAGYAQAPQPSALPQTPALTLDKALDIIKDDNFKKTLQIAWQESRISQLEQRILALQQELEDAKKAAAGKTAGEKKAGGR